MGSRNLISAGVVAALATTTGACVVDDSDSTFTLINDSSYVLVEVHLAEVGDRSWGPDLVPGDLFPGEDLVVTDISCGDYDVLVVDETGVECVLSNIDLCFEDEVWVIDDFTLDVCAFSG
jgi:hypothetical protein